jgi:Coenzyme PQQ synthesis protein D (PqqD)
VSVPASTGWVELEGTVYAARLPDGPPVVLTDAAALIWDVVLDGGTVEQVVAEVAAATGESATTVEPAVVAFVSGLVDAGVLSLVPSTNDD